MIPTEFLWIFTPDENLCIWAYWLVWFPLARQQNLASHAPKGPGCSLLSSPELPERAVCDQGIWETRSAVPQSQTPRGGLCCLVDMCGRFQVLWLGLVCSKHNCCIYYSSWCRRMSKPEHMPLLLAVASCLSWLSTVTRVAAQDCFQPL